MKKKTKAESNKAKNKVIKLQVNQLDQILYIKKQLLSLAKVIHNVNYPYESCVLKRGNPQNVFVLNTMKIENTDEHYILGWYPKYDESINDLKVFFIDKEMRLAPITPSSQKVLLKRMVPSNRTVKKAIQELMSELYLFEQEKDLIDSKIELH